MLAVIIFLSVRAMAGSFEVACEDLDAHSVPASRAEPADAGLGLCERLCQALLQECLQTCGATASTCAIQVGASFIDSDVLEPIASRYVKGPAGAPLPPTEYTLCCKAYQAGHLCFHCPVLVDCTQASRLKCVPKPLHLCNVWSNEGSSLGMDIRCRPGCLDRYDIAS